MKKDYRKFLTKTYHHLYSKDFCMDQRKCFYCSEPSTCYDHRPAISLLPSLDIKEYLEKGSKFRLIPSCTLCNSYLSNTNFINIFDCLLFLKTKYNKKLDKFPVWSEKELEFISESLIGLILLNQEKRNVLIEKLENIQGRIYDSDEYY
jgi:hypothetical protein